MSTILITGIGQGIGKALAEKFLNEGHVVIGTVYDTTDIHSHDKLYTVSLDLSKSESISTCVENIKEINLPIDVVINNAGILADEDDTQVVVDKLRKTLEVNLIGTIDFTERIIPLVSTDGHIINISSSAGSLALAEEGASHYPYHYPSYKISKAALNMYTVTLALRLKAKGITVSSVHPGWVKTAMGGSDADTTPEQVAEEIYSFAFSHPESGHFWHNVIHMPW